MSRDTLASVARLCLDREQVERLLEARQAHGLPANSLWGGPARAWRNHDRNWSRTPLISASRV